MDSATDDGPTLTEGGPDVVVVSGDQVAEAPPATVLHETQIVDDGAFTVARCSCGWRSYARRSRPLARAEAADHKLLHAD